ncbi:MAG: HDOD domain-containing protein, partial [Sinobacteraceae bacterium]|nr:HDOD domain-containing protein [Nevskiaceae bacterium]
MATVDVIVISLVIVAAVGVGSAVAIIGGRARRTPAASGGATAPAAGGTSPEERPAAPAPASAGPAADPAASMEVAQSLASSLSVPEVFAELHELALGRGQRYEDLPPPQLAVASAVMESLEHAATQQRYAPRRPSMLPRLLSATNDERVSLRELTTIITQDPSLVGALLKIANSSYYRVTPEPVESVDRAVVLLGTDGIRSMITAALMQPIFRVSGNYFPRFPEIAWEHTFRAASASVPHNFLAEDESDPFAAELLALVMGLASIVIFRVTLDEYQKHPELKPDATVVASLLDTQCGAVARHIGASWDLSARTLAGVDAQGPDATSLVTP